MALLRLRLRMQTIPALDLRGLARQLAEAGDAVNVRADASVLRQQLGGGDHLAQDRARAEQAYRGLASLPRGRRNGTARE